MLKEIRMRVFHVGDGGFSLNSSMISENFRAGSGRTVSRVIMPDGTSRLLSSEEREPMGSDAATVAKGFLDSAKPSYPKHRIGAFVIGEWYFWEDKSAVGRPIRKGTLESVVETRGRDGKERYLLVFKSGEKETSFERLDLLSSGGFHKKETFGRLLKEWSA